MILRGPQRPDFLRHEVLADLLEATVERQAQAIALIDGPRHYSYAELNASADTVAHHLLSRGVQAGQMLGLWLPRGADLLLVQAGLAKAGVAWLPFDADTPAERIRVCLEDAGATALICPEAWQARLQPGSSPSGLSGPWPCAVWSYEPLQTPVTEPLLRRSGVQPEHPAYLIYTSGSTGKPKGIVISQGSICHFLRSENERLGIRAQDKVYQGFSVAFDMSFEEIWISYLVGASVWIAPKSLVADPEALTNALIAEQITVLHAVPTLLALFPRDVPNLRLINLGGEMCPQTVVERFALPHRQLFNTYGPTETTVSASLAQLHQGQAVTIGEPLPNYGLMVLDEQQQLLPQGQTGELCITGPGVASGYWGRPDLTAEKFLPNPYAEHAHEARMYRTGDLARIDEHGQVQCLGRVDDQVKIRGFRVELGEIEAALCAQPGVGTAAVVLKPWAGMDQLVAYLVLEQEQSASFDLGQLRQALRERLPPYMVPAAFELLPSMPRLTSGKIDRKDLKARPAPEQRASGEGDVPSTAAEIALFAVLQPLFPGQALHWQDDFFDDLGGHSLLVARLISGLRADERYRSISVHDVYLGRTLGALAERLSACETEAQAAAAQLHHASASSLAMNTPWLRRVSCALAQALVLPGLVGLRIMHWLVPFLTYHYYTGDEGDSIWMASLAALLVFLLTNMLSFGVAIAGKWLVLGRARAGRYPLWGWTYFRWWLADRLSEVPPVYLIAGSPLQRLYWRALGAKIGPESLLGSITLRAPDLLTVGHHASIGSSVNLENARVEQGCLVLGPIEVGDHAYIGSYATIEGGTRIEARGYLEGLSALAAGQTVPAAEVWDGVPARLCPERSIPSYPPVSDLPGWRYALHLLGYFLGAAWVSALFFMPVFPSFMLIDWVDAHWLDLTQHQASLGTSLSLYFLLALPASAVLVLLTILVAAALRWLVLPRLSPGTWPVHSWMYYRKWLTNQIQESCLHVLHGIYATVFAPWWYRLLGAKVGAGAEISTALGVVPDMLTLGRDTFIADAVMLGDEQIDQGWLSLQATVIGDRSFVGNGAYIPDGTVIPQDVLIGVQSKAPEAARMQAGDTWMGSPPMYLPAREPIRGFPEHLTFRPSPARRLARGLVEAVRTVLPLAFNIAVGYLIVLKVMPLAEAGRWQQALTALTLYGLVFGISSYVLVLLAKWLIIGRYRPRSAPMWSPFVWVSEAITNVYESVAVPNFIMFLRGTPWLPWAWRALGCQVGRGVFLDTVDITEFDCVSIGDFSALNAWSGPQTHLFEDRVMKIGRVHIGARVTVGARSTILYDTQVGEGSTLGPLSLVMKGETLTPHRAWIGSPVQAWRK